MKIVTFILQLLVTVDVPDPMLNAKSLQASDESKYTRNITCKNVPMVYYYLSKYVQLKLIKWQLYVTSKKFPDKGVFPFEKVVKKWLFSLISVL